MSESDNCLRVLRALEFAKWDGIAAAVGQQVSAKPLTRGTARLFNGKALVARLALKFDIPSVLLCLSSADCGHQCKAVGHGIPRASMQPWHNGMAPCNCLGAHVQEGLTNSGMLLQKWADSASEGQPAMASSPVEAARAVLHLAMVLLCPQAGPAKSSTGSTGSSKSERAPGQGATSAPAPGVKTAGACVTRTWGLGIDSS